MAVRHQADGNVTLCTHGISIVDCIDHRLLDCEAQLASLRQSDIEFRQFRLHKAAEACHLVNIVADGQRRRQRALKLLRRIADGQHRQVVALRGITHKPMHLFADGR